MGYREYVEISLALLFLALGVYDVAAYLVHGHEATLTHVIRSWASRWTILPFAAGCLAGHLFWP